MLLTGFFTGVLLFFAEQYVLADAPLYSIVVLIHDDNNYQLADDSRNLHSGSDAAFQSAVALGESCEACEVFIYRLKGVTKNIFGKKQKTGTVKMYRKSEFAGSFSYHRSPEKEVTLKEESDFYRGKSETMKRDPAEFRRWLVYFGHKIPEIPAEGYSRSFPSQKYSMENFAKGLKKFAASGDSRAFQAVVMSTCHSGTPLTASWISGASDYMIGSPEKMNLAYLSMSKIGELLAGFEPGEEPSLFRTLSLSMFDSLKSLKTGVTVGYYDLAGIRPFSGEIRRIYRKRLAEYRADPSPFSYRDCLDSFPEMLSLIPDEPFVVHKAPKFGRGSLRLHHSGWSCPLRMDSAAR